MLDKPSILTPTSMKHFVPRALSIVALGWGMVACGGSDDGFQFPGASGTSLPYEVMGKVANAEKTELRNGSYGSSLAPHPTLEGYFYGLSDRGPNAATEPTRTPSGIIFITPEYTPRIGLFKLTHEGKAELVSTILLKDPKGRPITGLPNSQFGGTGETPYNLDGSVVSLDPDGDGVKGFDESGLDSEGLVAMKDGTFWISDEYGPHIVHFDATGKEIERINPFAADPRNKAGRTLPAELSTRWPNRGMEGLTITPDGKTLVGMMQSNLYNPTSAVGSINLTRIVTVNIETGATAQYLYRQDAAGLANSEIVALSATSFLVVERDTKFYGIDTGVVRKNIYKIDLGQATNVDRSNAALRSANASSLSVHAANGLLVDGKTLELVVKDGGTADNYAAGWAQLAALGIRPVAKTLAYDAIASQKYPHDKLEGMWVIDASRLAILNDADFVIAPDNLGGIKQKYLYDGKADSNMLYVVKPIAPLY
jgi:hypothetical protein